MGRRVLGDNNWDLEKEVMRRYESGMRGDEKR